MRPISSVLVPIFLRLLAQKNVPSNATVCWSSFAECQGCVIVVPLLRVNLRVSEFVPIGASSAVTRKSLTLNCALRSHGISLVYK